MLLDAKHLMIILNGEESLAMRRGEPQSLINHIQIAAQEMADEKHQTIFIYDHHCNLLDYSFPGGK